MYKLASSTLRDLLIQSSASYAGRPALAFVDGSLTLAYRDLAPLAAILAARLRAAGLVPGDAVLLLSESRPEWGVAYLGICAAGLVAVPVLPEFRTEQVAAIAAHCEAAAAVVSAKLAAKLEGFSGALLPIESVASREALAAAAELRPEESFPPVEEDALAAIIYTSGTTGAPKGVMLSHRNIVSNALATCAIMRLRRTDRLLSILPLAHTYECTIGFLVPLLQGCSIWYLDRPPVASALLPALRKIRPSVMVSVPLIIEKVYRSSVLPALQKMRAYRHARLRPFLRYLAGRKLKKTFGGRLRVFGVGGSALPADVERFMRDARFPYCIGYGLTESAPLLAGCRPFRTVPKAAGPAVQGVTLRIADPHPETGEGEIQARGPNVMRGYFNDPARSAEAFTEDGWLRTGDLGILDSRGVLYLRGRLKTVIIGSSGENIYPEEIEALINSSDCVAESLVYGEGKGLIALVQLKPEVLEKLKASALGRLEDMERGVVALLEKVRSDANVKLAAFSRITKVVFQRDPFEKTPTQKIKRFLYPKRGMES